MTIKRGYLRQIDGITFAGRTDTNHWVVMDGPSAFGGSNAAIRPKELVLLAVAGCMSSDIVSILHKKRVALDRFEVHVMAEESDEPPTVYTSIQMEFVLYGDGIRDVDVERAIELSDTKYCSVAAMLRPTVRISHTFRVVRSSVAAAV